MFLNTRACPNMELQTYVNTFECKHRVSYTSIYITGDSITAFSAVIFHFKNNICRDIDFNIMQIAINLLISMVVCERILRKFTSHLHPSIGKIDDCLGQWMHGSSRSTMQLLSPLPIPMPWKPCSATAFAFRKGNEYMDFIRDNVPCIFLSYFHSDPSSFFSE